MARPSPTSYFRGILLIGLIVAFAAPMVFASGGQESSKAQGPTLIWLSSVQGGRTPEEIPLFQNEVYRLTGIKVQMIQPPDSEYNNKLTTMLSTGEPLDLVYIDASIFESLYAQNPTMFAPLTKWIEASPVLSDPQVIPKSEWDRIRRSNGEIYAVFNKFEQGTMPIIRMDWLKKLGLPVPKTFDDYYNVLKAFTFNDPDGNGKNDTYGAVMGYTLYDSSGLFGAYGLARGFQKDASGNLYSPYATDAAIPVYQFFARLYKEGILEPNFVTNQSSTFRNIFMTDKAGMTFYWAAWCGLFNQQVHAQNPNSPFDAEGIAPPIGPNGKQMLRSGPDGLMVTPTSSKNNQLAFKIMEFWNTPAGNILGSLGIKGYDYNVTDGKYVLTQIGKEHAEDHGSPQPKSLKWKNPLGELPGNDAAFEIIRQLGQPQMITAHDTDWENITRAEAAKIILGQITPQQGIANMNARFKEAGIIQ